MEDREMKEMRGIKGLGYAFGCRCGAALRAASFAGRMPAPQPRLGHILGMIVMLTYAGCLCWGVPSTSSLPGRPSTGYFGENADFFQGKELYLKGETVQCRSFIEKYLKENPQGTFILESRFLLAITETDLERAKDAFWQMYRDAPDEQLSRIACFQYASLLLLDGDYSEASEVFEQLALTKDLGGELPASQRDLYPTNSFDLPGFGVDGLYVATLVLADKIAAAQNALDQFARNASSKTASEKWKLLSGVVAHKMGKNKEGERILGQFITGKSSSETAASACYYILSFMGGQLETQKQKSLANFLSENFPNSPECHLYRASRDANPPSNEEGN